MVIAFWGNRDAPQEVKGVLHKVLTDLIEKEGADRFYVGNQGNFDRIVIAALRELKKDYPHICYHIVLAYMPNEKGGPNTEETLYPAEAAVAPARFAIDRRNRWMLQRCDTVITYVRHTYGGAAELKKKALFQRKRVIELS